MLYLIGFQLLILQKSLRFLILITLFFKYLLSRTQVISFVKPMNQQIKNWHVVNTQEEMQTKALEILQDPEIKYERTLVYSISDSARAVMNLFGYAE